MAFYRVVGSKLIERVWGSKSARQAKIYIEGGQEAADEEQEDETLECLTAILAETVEVFLSRF